MFYEFYLFRFFFFKQKTAYDMRISDWSSDVCSSDLARDATIHRILQQMSQILAQGWRDAMVDKFLDPALGLNQRIGAKAIDRRGAGKDRPGAATRCNEATGKILIRCRRLGFPRARKSTRLKSSNYCASRMLSYAEQK